MFRCRDLMVGGLPEERQQHVLDGVVFAATVEVGGQELPPLLFGFAERPVRIGREYRDGLRSDMAEVAVVVLAVGRLEVLGAENLVERASARGSSGRSL